MFRSEQTSEPHFGAGPSPLGGAPALAVHRAAPAPPPPPAEVRGGPASPSRLDGAPGDSSSPAAIAELRLVAVAIEQVTRAVVRAESSPAGGYPLLAVALEPLDERTPLARLAAAARLPPTAVQVLRILTAGELDRHSHRALRRLAEDPSQGGIEIDAVVTVAEAIGVQPLEALAALQPDSPLFTRGLVSWVSPDGPLLTRCVTVPYRVLNHLRGAAQGPPEVPPLLPEPALPVERLVLAPDGEAIGDVLARLPAALLAGRPVWLVGPPGVGKRTLAGALSAEIGRAALCLDYRWLISQPADGLAPLLWREILLSGGVLCIHDAAPLGDDAPHALLDRYRAMVRAGLPLIFTSTERPVLAGLDPPPLVLTLALPAVAERTALWAAALPACDGPDEMGSAFRLTPGRIMAAAAAALQAAARAGRRPRREDAVSAVSAQVAQDVEILGHRVHDAQDWSDVVLPPETEDAVAELISRARCRHQVLEQWGFHRKLAKGVGLAALFTGPPGTGKTMVAGLIARELGLELYQIDLSRIVSKWVGETEKNLALVFDAAEGTNVLLLFDEADALFSRRTAEVRSSVDRYSNAEINYLLQRVERFEGVSILTTNLEGAIDPAFKRRLAFRINFPMPEVEERLALWRSLVPREARVDEELDFEGLAAGYELTGGNIRNVVLRAAFLAAGEGVGITMDHLQRAVALEYRDAGKLSATGRLS